MTQTRTRELALFAVLPAVDLGVNQAVRWMGRDSAPGHPLHGREGRRDVGRHGLELLELQSLARRGGVAVRVLLLLKIYYENGEA